MIAAYGRMGREAQMFLLLAVLIVYVAGMVAVMQWRPALNHSMWFGVPMLLVFALILSALMERMIASLNRR